MKKGLLLGGGFLALFLAYRYYNKKNSNMIEVKKNEKLKADYLAELEKSKVRSELTMKDIPNLKKDNPNLSVLELRQIVLKNKQNSTKYEI